MKEYFLEEKSYLNKHHIIFLCGVSFNPKNEKDKRIVLKRYFENLDDRNKVIILEENFIFGKSTKKYLAYDDIFLNNLKDIESLMALFSDFVFIIHESLSTAAELGVFGSNELLNSKLCVLVPDEYSVEEKKISNFIRLAFFKDTSDIGKIIYYPPTTINKISESKIDFHTEFFNSEIGENLSNNIKNFTDGKIEENATIKFIKAPFDKGNQKMNYSIYYNYDKDEKCISVYLSSKLVLDHIISFFSCDDFKTEIRRSKIIDEHVTFVQNFYVSTLKATFDEINGIVSEEITISINGTTLKFRQVVAFSLYLLQAMSFISFEQDDLEVLKRKVSISNDFNASCKEYSGLISLKKTSKFGGILE